MFGWGIEKTGDTDEFRYYQGQIDGETVAGLMDSASFLPAEVPSHWAVYFSVADADEAVAQVVELGGSVVARPRTPRSGASPTRPTAPARRSRSIRRSSPPRADVGWVTDGQLPSDRVPTG